MLNETGDMPLVVLITDRVRTCITSCSLGNALGYTCWHSCLFTNVRLHMLALLPLHECSNVSSILAWQAFSVPSITSLLMVYTEQKECPYKVMLRLSAPKSKLQKRPTTQPISCIKKIPIATKVDCHHKSISSHIYLWVLPPSFTSP